MAPNQPSGNAKPVTISTLNAMKQRGEKFASLTAYDASFAALVEEAGAEVILVGDSLGMVVQGHSTTVPVTIDDIVYHTRIVARGLKRALLIADMPFLSYASPDLALANAGRLMQEGLAHMVKIEGRQDQVGIVERFARADVPVCVHIGLRPQSVHKMGGYRVQGKGEAAAAELLEDAKRLESAGADLLLIECVSSPAAARITREVRIPVIGIGAGPDVDAQVLVLYDILGITRGPMPKFSKNFSEGASSPLDALSRYVTAVKDGSYPAPEHCFA